MSLSCSLCLRVQQMPSMPATAGPIGRENIRFGPITFYLSSFFVHILITLIQNRLQQLILEVKKHLLVPIYIEMLLLGDAISRLISIDWP